MASKKQTRSKQKTYRNIKKWWLYNRKMSHYLYYQKCYRLICIDLSRETNTSLPQPINFVGKLEDDDDPTMLFIAGK